MFNLPLAVILLIGFTTAHEYWVQDNYQTGGAVAGFPAGCQCTCDQRSSDRERGSLGGSSRRRRRQNSHTRRRSRKRGSRDNIIDTGAALLPLDSGSNLVQSNDGPLLSRDFAGVRMTDNIAIPESPLQPVNSNSGQLGFAVGNTRITDNQGLIDGSSLDGAMYDQYGYDNAVDNGFNYDYNGMANEGTLIGDTAGFATDPNLDVRDRFTSDRFTRIGDFQDGGRGFGRSKFDRRQRKRTHIY